MTEAICSHGTNHSAIAGTQQVLSMYVHICSFSVHWNLRTVLEQVHYSFAPACREHASRAGGISGSHTQVDVNYCWNTGNIKGTGSGGICGSNVSSSCEIKYCYNKGAIETQTSPNNRVKSMREQLIVDNSTILC